MTTAFTRQLVIAVALAAAAATAATAQAAGMSQPGARDPFSDGARSVQAQRSPFTDGARAVHEARDPYAEGARSIGSYDAAERIIAGLDRTGASADPARSLDPYLDGARA
jgi:hypothetical protein